MKDSSLGGARLHDEPLGVARHLDHGVDDEMDGEIVAAELRRHGIDEERHVVIDDLDDGMGAVPAMLVDAGIVDPDLGLAGQTLLAVIPEGEGGAIEVLDLRPHQIVRRHIGVEFADEARCRLGPRAVQPLQGQRHRFLDQLSS